MHWRSHYPEITDSDRLDFLDEQIHGVSIGRTNDGDVVVVVQTANAYAPLPPCVAVDVRHAVDLAIADVVATGKVAGRAI